MSATTVGGLLWVPPIPECIASTDNNISLDATTDYYAFVIRIPKTGTIDKVHVRLGSSNLIGTLSVRIYNLDSSGDPDTGSVYGSCAQSDKAVTGSDANTNLTFGSLACSATAGDEVAVVVWPSAVTSGSGGIISPASPFAIAPFLLFPYRSTRQTGSGAGTHGAGSSGNGVSLEYSGGVFYPTGAFPAGSAASPVSLDNDGSIRRAGNIVTVPVPMTCVGAWVVGDNDNDTTTIKLYDTDGTTVLATATLTATHRGSTSVGITPVLWDSGTEVSLVKGSTYRLVLQTTSTSSTGAILHTYSSMVALAHQDQLPLGQNCYYTEHNGTSWSETTTRRAHIGFLISKLDDGVGGGGPLIDGRLVR